MLQILICYIINAAMIFTRFLVKEGRKGGKGKKRSGGRKGEKEEGWEREEGRGRRKC